MNRLLAIASRQDIPPQYRDTPIGLLLEYHNLNRFFDSYSNAELLIGMCMNNRKHLQVPDNFAFVISDTRRRRGWQVEDFPDL